MITSIRGPNLEDHVDSYFSVDMFKSAYEEAIPALPDKSSGLSLSMVSSCIHHCSNQLLEGERHRGIKAVLKVGKVEKGGTSVQFASNMDTTGGPTKMVIQKTKLPCLQPGIIKLHNSCNLYLYFL